jgi:hypothetical protein
MSSRRAALRIVAASFGVIGIEMRSVFSCPLGFIGSCIEVLRKSSDKKQIAKEKVPLLNYFFQQP